VSTVDATDFWADAPDDWVGDVPPWHEYVGPELTDELVRAAEHALGYKLPASYLRLLRAQNGGLPRRRCFPVGRGHVEITGLYGVGGWYGIDNPDRGSRSMIQEWGYPASGVIIAPTPSGGHDAVMLDYSDCGPTGEPRVIHVETETAVPRVRVLSPNFAAFVAGLAECPEQG
jgi:SMI1 / KNR4 family (SUKH-1)